MATSAHTSTGVTCGAGLSTRSELRAALDEALDQAQSQLTGACDLAFAFISARYAEPWDGIAGRLADRLQCPATLGCTGESIVGLGREIEQEPAVAVWLAHLSGARLTPMRLSYERTPEGGSFTGWPHDLPGQWTPGSALFCLADPFSFPADELIARINEDHPGVPVLGGMASGAARPGENRLILGAEVFDDGAATVLVEGLTSLRTIVSQGCRPIGQPLVVTKADRNVILELGGAPALEKLHAIYADLTAEEQQLVRHGLHVGLVTNEYQADFRRGDFLVRNVIGADPKTGAVAIGDYVRVGQTVQYHIRDAATADEDLRSLLATVDTASPPAGALLFTCNGRGTRLFPRPNHDVSCLTDALGPLPTAGFFAQGELGPIGGKNFLHGFTASIAIFG